MGHQCDLKNGGDYLTFQAFNERILVIRDHANHINAFHNVCKHRGGRVVEQQTGNCRYAITCPFHGWTYGLDGSLQGVPASSTFKSLDMSSIGLSSVDCELWMGFIFVRLDSGGESLAEQMKPIEHEVLPYKLDELDALAPESDELRPYNWKVIHDIDNEGYHVPIGHPSLQQLYGRHYVDTVEHGFAVSRGRFNETIGSNWSVKNYRKLLPEFEHLPIERHALWLYVGLFPNLVFALYPDMLEVYMTIPVSVDETRYISRTFALPDTRREVRAARYLNMRINNETCDEDEKYVGWLQEGMKSSAWEPPRLSDELERGVRDFHKAIQRHIPISRFASAPKSREMANLNAELLAQTGNPRPSVRIR